MSTNELVLFDLDGTLIDPFVGLAEAYRSACRAVKLPVPTDNEIVALIGPPLHDVLASHFGLSGSAFDTALAAHRAYFSNQGVLEFRVYPRIRAMLAELERSDVSLAVATSKPTVFAEQVLQHAGLADAFVFVGGATLDGSRRQKAEIIAHVLEALGPRCRPLAMVGDRREDVVGAAEHHIPTFGAGWGYGARGELAEAGVRRVLANPAELTGALRALLEEEGRRMGPVSGHDGP